MNKKFSLGVCISLIAIACAITFVLTMTLSLNMYNAKIAGVTEREEIYTKMQEIDSFVRNNYLYPLDEDALTESILDGYASGVDDSYASYMTSEEYYKVQQREAGTIIGVGIEVAKEAGGYITITKVYGGSPAEEAGIAAGDVITAVGGEDVLSLGAEKAMQQLDGDEGTRLTFTTQRSGVENNYNLLRTEVVVKTVSSSITDGIAYIRVSSLNKLTGADFTAEIDAAVSDDTVKGIIIDLRQCGSMVYAPLSEMINRLVKETVAATAEYKDGITKNYIVTNDEQSISLPIEVLIDSGTSGAGELFAAMLKDLTGAKLIGSNSAGNGILTATQSFKDGTAVTVTTATLKSSVTAFAGGIGLKPDFIVDTAGDLSANAETPDVQNDTQYAKAIEVMQTTISAQK